MSPALSLALLLVVSDVNSRRSPVVQVVDRVSPAVVYIGTVQVVEQRFRSRSVFDELFFGPQEERRAVEGLGSGVIIDPSGVIVTNDHVIRGASEIHVVLADGRQLDAEVVGSDADNDLAVLKVSAARPLPSARLGTSGDLMIGETVVAIGSPLGLNLVEGFNESREDVNENAVWVGGALWPVGRARFRWNHDDPLDRWHVSTTDGAVDLTFRPIATHREDRDLVLVRTRFLQPLGTWEGTVRVGGRVHVLRGVPGVAEDQNATW